MISKPETYIDLRPLQALKGARYPLRAWPILGQFFGRVQLFRVVLSSVPLSENPLKTGPSATSDNRLRLLKTALNTTHNRKSVGSNPTGPTIL